ncbi:MAG: 3-isopropylmalate dehydrogenase [Candidatus Nanopelagicales bacterium]
MSRSYKLAVIPGDGIGIEVTAEALKVLQAAAARDDVTFDTTEYDLGARQYHSSGEALPDAVLAQLRSHDAILLGAIGDPSVPPGVLERGLLLRMRFELDHAVNLRPVQLLPGVTSPVATATTETVDMIVCREGTEGLYCGAGGFLRKNTVGEVATEESINTWSGVERIVRDAFERAAARPRSKLTLVHKTNVLVHAGDLYQRVVNAVAVDFPTVTVDYCHIDAATIYFVTDPGRFDVIITDNMFGDILTDLGAAVAGGIGLAASGNLNVDGTAPSMFEPVHGSAPDIAGQGIADPTAAVMSAAMLLEHLGEAVAAERIQAAVAADLANRANRGSQTRSTTEIGDALAAAVAGTG